MKKLLFNFLALLFIQSNLISQNLNTGLVACYPLNGNGTELINNLTGTLSLVTPTVNRFNSAASACFFNGTTNCNIALSDNAFLKNQVISFSAWVNFTSLNTGQFLAFVYNGCTVNQEGYQLGADSQQFQIATSNGTCSSQVILNSTVAPVTNTWYHIGFYAGQDSLKIYVNGNLSGAMLNSFPLAYGPGTNVFLGGSLGATINLPMFGSMDNVRFYNRKLSNAEFMQLYTQDPTCETSVGLTENGFANDPIVYPNPSSGLFNLANTHLVSFNYLVTDIYGKWIMEGKNQPESSLKIDLTEQPGGVYFIRLNNENGTVVKRLIKSE